MRPVDACETKAGRPSRRRTSCSDTHGASTARPALKYRGAVAYASSLWVNSGQRALSSLWNLTSSEQSCSLDVETSVARREVRPRADNETRTSGVTRALLGYDGSGGAVDEWVSGGAGRERRRQRTRRSEVVPVANSAGFEDSRTYWSYEARVAENENETRTSVV
ncbi:hypothetical protein PF003_g22336 [Phytophthora fragariae]|nr:hypothetical protein PF003_g22336 [Phytophthora fragariae]